jgi:multiple antibiotic resistance protein
MLLEIATAFLSMFIIIDPLSSVPIFLTLTKKATISERLKAARDASIVAAFVLVVFILVGPNVLEIMGISFQSFKIAGGLVLLLVGVYSVLGIAYAEKSSQLDVAVVLIAVPMLTGPGALSMAIILSKEYGVLITSIASVAAVALTWVFLRFSTNAQKLLGIRGLEIYSRLFGLFIAALAIQFISEGIIAMVKSA